MFKLVSDLTNLFNLPSPFFREPGWHLRNDSPEMLPRLGGISHSPLSPEKSVAYYCARKMA